MRTDDGGYAVCESTKELWSSVWAPFSVEIIKKRSSQRICRNLTTILQCGFHAKYFRSAREAKIWMEKNAFKSKVVPCVHTKWYAN